MIEENQEEVVRALVYIKLIINELKDELNDPEFDNYKDFEEFLKLATDKISKELQFIIENIKPETFSNYLSKWERKILK